MHVAYAWVTMPCPHWRNGKHSRDPLSVAVIRTWEVDTPEGVVPLEWMLVAKDAADADEACRWVAAYEARWVIEEYHKGCKTGCGIENMQFTTTAAWEPSIAVLCVVALFLLKLRDWGSRSDKADLPACEFIDIEYVELSSLSRWKKLKPDMSLGEFLLASARLGGHQNRKNDGMPGWPTLWRGWTRLQAMMQGAAAMKIKRSG